MKNQSSKSDFFITYALGHALLVTLSDSYAQVGRELASLEGLLQELKSRRGERLLDGNSAGTPLMLERERAYEVAALRVQIAWGSLFNAVGELLPDIEAVDSAIEGGGFDALLDKTVAQNNVLCARERLETAMALYYDTLNRQINSASSGTVRAIDIFYEQKKGLPNARVFVVKYNYNDSRYNYTQGDGAIAPEGPHMTFEEARDAASNWIGFSNGVGDAVIENLSTGQFYTFDGRPIQGEF